MSIHVPINCYWTLRPFGYLPLSIGPLSQMSHGWNVLWIYLYMVVMWNISSVVQCLSVMTISPTFVTHQPESSFSSMGQEVIVALRQKENFLLFFSFEAKTKNWKHNKNHTRRNKRQKVDLTWFIAWRKIILILKLAGCDVLRKAPAAKSLYWYIFKDDDILLWFLYR